MVRKTNIVWGLFTGAMIALGGCNKTPSAPEPTPKPQPAVPGSSAVAADTSSAAAVFEQRLAPIFKSPIPSSCAQCHLAAVDLKDYILPSSKDTFLALRDQGLIDLEKPENSKILKLINRGANEKYGANLIPAKQRQAEYDAFAAWIKACAADPALKIAPKPEKTPALATKPVEVVRHARKDRMTESFEANVWAIRFRCMNCHTEGTPERQAATGERRSGRVVQKGRPGSDDGVPAREQAHQPRRPRAEPALNQAARHCEARRRHQVRAGRSGLQGDARMDRRRSCLLIADRKGSTLAGSR
jgi:hypothetical protein